ERSPPPGGRSETRGHPARNPLWPRDGAKERAQYELLRPSGTDSYECDPFHGFRFAPPVATFRRPLRGDASLLPIDSGCCSQDRLGTSRSPRFSVSFPPLASLAYSG